MPEFDPLFDPGCGPVRRGSGEEDPVAQNFAGVPSRAGGDPARSRLVLLQAPFEGTVTYGSGASRGPRAILEASLQVETFDEETGVDLEELSFALGPVIRPEGPDPAAYAARVQSAVRAVVEGGKLPFVLGGEHSVSIGAVRAVREAHPDAHFLAIDAHADLRDRYEGHDFSHACVARRVHEGGAVTVLGVRSYSAAEAEYAARAENLKLVSARTALSPDFSVDKFAAALGPAVYVSVDVDGFDPAVIPDTGTPEPGGLTWGLVLDVLAEVARRRRVVGLDLVELAPTPGGRASAFAAARLVAKMITYALREEP